MATSHAYFLDKIQDNFPNNKQSYSLHCGFGEKKNGKICTFEVPILLVTVYVAPSNKVNNYINHVLQ